ncbi:MAG TPA: M24 family metallopeptidase [Acidimicrobiales bacterium]|nr:M24 family metallopeptidase [Acidimicrobiales bacterium]
MTEARAGVPVPEHGRPRIGQEELALRRAKLTELLSERGADAWLAYGDDGAVAGPDHVRYLTNVAPHFEPVLVAGGTAGRSVLLTGPETAEYARAVVAGAIEVLSISELAHSSEEYPTIELRSGLELLRDVVGRSAALALLGADRVPHSLYSSVIEPLEAHHRVEAVGEEAYTLRRVKTAAEQLVIDEAYRIALTGLRAALDVLWPGAIEREVAAEAEYAMRRAGAEGFGIDTMVASGISNTRPILARSTFREIARDDLVCITLAPRYEGYHAAMARPFLFQANPSVERAVEVAKEAQRMAEVSLRTGSEGRSAESAARAVVVRSGVDAEFPYVGIHTIGVIEFEPPIFASGSSARVEEGMALSIDIPMFHAPWGGFRVEDGFAIRDGHAAPRVDRYQEVVPLLLH